MSVFTALIIDEHPIVRRGVAEVVRERWPDAAIAEASTPEDAEVAAADLVILDPWRSGSGVGALVKRLDERFGAPIVVLTSERGSRQLADALRAGVRAYVRKGAPNEDLARALEAARAGEHYVDPSLSSAIVLEEGDRTLSARQLEILQMLADGMQTDAVANRLGLSTETVRTHTKRILAKLEASTRTQAVAIGLRNGFID